MRFTINQFLSSFRVFSYSSFILFKNLNDFLSEYINNVMNVSFST